MSTQATCLALAQQTYDEIAALSAPALPTIAEQLAALQEQVTTVQQQVTALQAKIDAAKVALA